MIYQYVYLFMEVFKENEITIANKGLCVLLWSWSVIFM